MRIVCLPIDSRPCNTQFIRSLTEWAGGELTLPSKEIQDDFTRPAAFEDSLRFLKEALPGADGAVISLDHLCYGSLLASREESVTDEEALDRAACLRELAREHAGVPIYLNTVVLRSSISTLKAGDLGAYEAMTAYSESSDRWERFRLPADRKRMEEAMARLPEGLLERTLRIRKRNLRVNLAAVEMAAEGLLAGLSIVQEDSQEYGLPRKDQRVIEQRLKELGLEGIRIRNGTDEAGAVQAAKALCRGREPLEAEIRWIGDGNFTAPYEDRPFRENVETACAEAGIRQTEGSGTVILILCPERGEKAEVTEPMSETWLNRCAEAADAAVGEGGRVYLLDVMRANGGVPELMGRMREADGLWGYSAWNTASNALGTLLAQAVTDGMAGKPNRAFLQERLLDDMAYEGRIRGLLNARLREKREDVFHLRDKAGAERLLREAYEDELRAIWPLRQMPRYRVSLPWNRTFEVKAEILGEEPEN